MTSAVPAAARASAAQEALWLSPFAGATPDPAHLLWSLAFRGPLATDRLQEALARLVQRHPALRTTFRWAGRHLEAHVASDMPPGLPVEESAAAAWPELARHFGSSPYDPGSGPLFRFRLLRLAADDHVLLCGFHHLVMDGSSWPVFADDLLRLLAGDDLPQLPASVPAAVAPAEAAAALRYWRAKAEAVPQAWEPMPDRLAGGGRTSQGAECTLQLPEGSAASLRTAAAALRSTPFRVALAAFAAFLGVLGRREDVAVATTLVGRTGEAQARQVGLYVTTAVIHPEIAAGVALRAVVGQVHAQVDEAVAHQGHPYAAVARELLRPRDPTVHPFTEAGFTKLPPAIRRRAGALAAWDRRIFLPGVDRDLSVYFQEQGHGYALTWTWRCDRFEAGTIGRWSAWFLRFLAQALAEPDLPLDRIDLLDAAGRRQVLLECNATDRAFPGRQPLHRLVEAQVARTPGRIAVVEPGRRWTYRQVDAAANAVAAQLHRRGVGRGAFVPVVMAPSAGMLVAELAAMKCGAAFVPLDPDWPAQRLAALVGRLQAPCVVVADAEAPATAALGRECIGLAQLPLDVDPGPVPCEAGLDDPIYCIFTSGSSGEPKGAVNRHRGIVNRLLSMSDAFGTAADDVVLATAGSGVDTLVWQFFWPLACGGRVVVAPREQVVAGQPLCRLLQAHGVTVADFVPTVFQGLVRHLAAQPVELAALRLVIIGGEAMNAAAVGEFQALHPAVGVVNTYGPTEASIGSVWYRVPAGCPGPVPIGRPLPNVRAVILDRQGRPAPPGMVGELCLGGDCVGLGYLGDPDGTRARFIANPFPELRCDTLYRTGDAARLRPDGLLECLGRLDDQLKIRGLRIEPGEVEAALLRHPAVQQAVVTAVAGSGQLRAHLVFAPSVPQPGAGALRDFLLGLLPQFMVPSAFVAVPRLPAASSGKIDRRAVAALPGKVLKQAPPYAPPTTQAERALLALWRELLAVERIGIHDNFFFDLGGDSLQALLFVGRWEAWTGCRTGVSRLFAAPTIASFAASLAASGEAPGAGHDLLALQRAHVAGWKGARLSPQSLLFAATPSGCAHPLFWCCQGFHELAQMARHLGAQQPLVGMRSGHLVMEYTPANLDLLAGHYASEIVLAQPQGAIVLGGNCQGGLVARAVALHLQRAGREVALLILMEDSQFGPYDGRVALLYGSDSHLNPFRGGRDPGAILGQAYSRGYSVAFIPGSHGKFFRDENIPGLAAAMAACMEAAAPARPAALSGCFEGQGG